MQIFDLKCLQASPNKPDRLLLDYVVFLFNTVSGYIVIVLYVKRGHPSVLVL